MAGQFRTDIQGLRALAVSLVVLFHADVPLVSGGYVGVDVFYVISGFLITGLLFRERVSTGRIRLLDFYARRIRRLLPAAVFVLMATLVLVYVFWPPLARVGIIRDAQATATYLSNVWFAYVQTDYLASETPSPLLHYWSLAVEEQFYLGWPVLMVLATLGTRAPGRRALASIAVVSVVSFAACVYVTSWSQPWAFFSLPTRAWELGVGACLALLVPRMRGIGVRTRSALGWAGLGAVLVSALTFTEQTPFPGWHAAVPVLGTAAIIAVGSTDAPSPLAAVLDLPAAQWLGKVSYSLYLWHWPLMVVPAVAVAAPLSAAVRALLVATALALSWATYVLVEDRFRQAVPLLRRKWGSFFLGGGLTAAAASLTLWLSVLPTLNAGRAVEPLSPGADILSADVPSYVPSNLRPSLVQVADDLPAIYADGCHVDAPQVRSPECLYGQPNAPDTVVLFGDSHAAQWFPALNLAATEAGWRLLNLTKSACPSVSVTTWQVSLRRAYAECNTWRENAFRRIQQTQPSLVIIANSSRHQLVGHRTWREGLTTTLERVPRSSRVVILSDTPAFAQNPAICLSAHLSSADKCALPVEQAVDLNRSHIERRVAHDQAAVFVDVLKWVCRDGTCPVIVADLLVYRDTHHLATPFTTHLAGRFGALLRTHGDPAS